MEQGIATAVLCIVAGGIAAQLLAARLRIPAIVLLLGLGFHVGPLLVLLHPTEALGANLRPLAERHASGWRFRVEPIDGAGTSIASSLLVIRSGGRLDFQSPDHDPPRPRPATDCSCSPRGRGRGIRRDVRIIASRVSRAGRRCPPTGALGAESPDRASSRRALRSVRARPLARPEVMVPRLNPRPWIRGRGRAYVGPTKAPATSTDVSPRSPGNAAPRRRDRSSQVGHPGLVDVPAMGRSRRDTEG